MLFENPANAAKLFPAYNLPPPVRISGVDASHAALLEHAVAHQMPDLHAHVLGAQAAAQAAAAAHAAAAAAQASALQQHQQQPPPTQIATKPLQKMEPQSPGRCTPTSSAGQQQLNANSGQGATASPGKLFVGGLSWQTSSERLREYFNMFGAVTDVLIMKDPITQRSRGFGFITFAEASSVENVLKVPVHTLDGKKIDPKHATPKNRPNKTKKIFVGGVGQDTSADEVKAYFSQFGLVEETVMLMDQQTKRHRGFGFVTFESEEAVDRVCEIHFHTVKNKKVECKRAQPKEAVAAAVPLALGKRLVLAGGLRAPAMPPNAALAAAPAAGRLIYPTLGYRYTPYAIPTPTAAAPPQPTAPYSLTAVDMSSFQGVDWSSMYGVGMYL